MLRPSRARARKSAAFPELWSSAFSRRERYALRELAALVGYARARGVAVLPEFDSPGHAKSMCAGAPPGVCMRNCSASANWPLRLSDATFAFLEALGLEQAASFPLALRHVGGDEVETACWDEDAASAAWMARAGLNATAAYSYFVERLANISAAHGKRAVAWDDAWRDFGAAGTAAGTVVMFWTSNAGKMQAAADAGRAIVAASEGPLYLSGNGLGDDDVASAYDYDPCDCANGVNDINCVNSTAACGRVLGLEAVFWTAQFDGSQARERERPGRDPAVAL